MSARGPLRAAILDWAGTTVDYGCRAPTVVLRRVFAAAGVEISDAEARRDMGLRKRDHIRALASLPRVAKAWAARHGAPPDERDVDRLFGEFTPLQIECLERYSTPVPGAVEAVARMRERGLKIGSTTGYTRAMLEVARRTAAAAGYAPDASVTPDEVGAGRPKPWMAFRNLQLLDVYPPEACVKIGDTPADIAEGLNAGMWTVGLVEGGNEIGLGLDDWSALGGAERAALAERARRRLFEAGAHEVAANLTCADDAIERIEARRRAGERP